MSRAENTYLAPALFDAARAKLEAVPLEKWPSEALYWKVLTLARLQAMENAEREALGQ